jgi:hypothetical protein
VPLRVKAVKLEYTLKSHPLSPSNPSPNRTDFGLPRPKPYSIIGLNFISLGCNWCAIRWSHWVLRKCQVWCHEPGPTAPAPAVSREGKRILCLPSSWALDSLDWLASVGGGHNSGAKIAAPSLKPIPIKTNSKDEMDRDADTVTTLSVTS